MQFAAVVLMALLTVKLLVLQRGGKMESVLARRSRRLMAAGTAVLALHFALQLKYGLRAMGITQAVALNLTLLIPASYIFAVAVLLLQRRGVLSRLDRWAGPSAWIAAMALLFGAGLSDGLPYLNDSPGLQQAEIIGAAVYMLMQGYYAWRHTSILLTMRRALDDYYDRDTDYLLRWMHLSILGLVLLALMVPVSMFGSGGWLLAIALAIYFFVFYLVDSFCNYLTSTDLARVQEAERNADEIEQEQSSDGGVTVRDGAVGRAVDEWIARGGYLKNGLLQPEAAEEIGVPKHQLKEYLRNLGLKYCEWIAALRVEEAKRVIREHPDWGNDAIAEHCGFSDRSVMQRTFKKLIGVTPAQWGA